MLRMKTYFHKDTKFIDVLITCLHAPSKWNKGEHYFGGYKSNNRTCNTIPAGCLGVQLFLILTLIFGQSVDKDH